MWVFGADAFQPFVSASRIYSTPISYRRGPPSENDIRACVTKRKISGGTISEKGRDARDIMLGLAKTCRKLNLSFYEFLGSRLGIPGLTIPPLAQLIRPAPS